MKKINNKIVATLLAGTMALSMVACASTDTASSNTTTSEVTESSVASTQEVTKIQFWYCWTDNIELNNLNLTEKFNETVGAELGVEVEAVYQGTYDECHSKLQASYIAGEAPAVSVMEIASTKTFAENGIIASMDELIAADEMDMTDFYEGLLENCIVDDTYYGIPYLRSTPILYKNVTLLEEAGLDPTGPNTWDELEEYCTVLNETLDVSGLTMYSYDWVLEAFFFQQGTSILSEDELSTNFNSEEGYRVFSFFQDLVNDGSVNVYLSADSSKVMTDATNQTAAMWFSSTGDLTKYQEIGEENGFQVETSYIPMDVAYGVPTGGCNLVMIEGLSSAEQTAAWEFIKFLTTTENTVYSSSLTGYVTVRKSASETEEMLALFEETPSAKVALDQLKDCGNGRPMNPNYAEAKQEFVDAMDAIWVNGADVQTTLDAAAEKANKILTQ